MSKRSPAPQSTSEQETREFKIECEEAEVLGRLSDLVDALAGLKMLARPDRDSVPADVQGLIAGFGALCGILSEHANDIHVRVDQLQVLRAGAR